MQIRKLFFFLISFFLIFNIFANGFNQTYVGKGTTKSAATKTIKKTSYQKPRQNYPYFNSIVADGNYNIHITQGRNAVHIANEGAFYTNTRVVDNTLMLEFVPQKKEQTPDDFPTVNVDVSMPVLNEISLLGNSTLHASNIRSYGLVLATSGNNNVQLDGTGVFNIAKIDARGNSDVSVQWVNSNDLLVEGDDYAQIKLAGVAKILQVRLAGTSLLDAKYLRPDIALVDTQDFATADILATHSLYAFATDHSNIYYYKTPGYYLDNTQISGNVLQLAHWQ